MKRIYFIRHGETNSNRLKVAQGMYDELSPLGELQAEKAAKRCLSLPIDTCIASDTKRTVQTAEIIKKSLQKDFTFSPLFRERRNPSSTIGLRVEEGERKKFVHEAVHKQRQEDGDWVFEDEESFNDVIERVKLSMHHLESLEGNDILVVTHARFLRFFASYIITNGLVTPKQYWDGIDPKLTLSNVGLSLFEVHDGEW